MMGAKLQIHTSFRCELLQPWIYFASKKWSLEEERSSKKIKSLVTL